MIIRKLLIFFLLLTLTSWADQKIDTSRYTYDHGAIIRFDQRSKKICMVFTGGDFACGGKMILKTLKKHKINGAFFFTGDFYRRPEFAETIHKLHKAGHYLGAHSNKHLLYAPWENRDSVLVSKEQFTQDLLDNYKEMARFGVKQSDAPYFLPPFEWFNDSITQWTNDLGLTLVNFSPGTSSNQDWTIPELARQYITTDSIYQRVMDFEQNSPNGLNGFMLLTHIGADPRRPDMFYHKLDNLIRDLKKRGYSFIPLSLAIPLHP